MVWAAVAWAEAIACPRPAPRKAGGKERAVEGVAGAGGIDRVFHLHRVDRHRLARRDAEAGMLAVLDDDEVGSQSLR